MFRSTRAAVRAIDSYNSSNAINNDDDELDASDDDDDVDFDELRRKKRIATSALLSGRVRTSVPLRVNVVGIVLGDELRARLRALKTTLATQLKTRESIVPVREARLRIVEQQVSRIMSMSSELK